MNDTKTLPQRRCTCDLTIDALAQSEYDLTTLAANLQADLRGYQLLAHEALAHVAALTKRLEQKQEIIESLRDQLRVLVGVQRERAA